MSISKVKEHLGNSPVEVATRLNPGHTQSMLTKYGIKTPKKAHLSNDIKLVYIEKAFGYLTLKTILKAWLNDLNKFIGAKDKINEQQADELAELIYEECYDYNIAELALLFRNIKKLRYGEFYGAVDPSRIMLFISEYASERKAAIISIGKQVERLEKEAYYLKAKTITSAIQEGRLSNGD